MDGRVVIYQLTAKVVDSASSVPDDARDIIYYTLSVGHHTGVMDCLTPRLSCTIDTFRSVLACLPKGPCRSKLEGIETFGEIQIDQSHVPVLAPGLKAAQKALYVKKDAKPYSDEIAWLGGFLQLLEAVRSERALYLMGKRIDG